MAVRKPKDSDLRRYELLEYFSAIARNADITMAGDIILHNIVEKCPAHYLDEVDSYMSGKLLVLLECCLEALQSVPDDRATPFPVKSALSRLGQWLTDIGDPNLKELEELLNGGKRKV